MNDKGVTVRQYRLQRRGAEMAHADQNEPIVIGDLAANTQ